ncbi:Glyoxalase/bleomycin resistance protein/dioxygenase domain protein [mine drainage metagenome]|uniref:Glyoxalase/bleomycin resistance protein/dioxygenase domain protein n=1 Tax=mine drainage metagenome TaxID=410659 RepID=T1A120_9ZZZZ
MPNEMKFLHTSITVRKMDESLRFYTEVLGLEFERRRSIPENRAEIAFVRDPESGARIELTHWDGKEAVEPGEQLDHLAFEVPDLDAFLAAARARGARVAKEPYRLAGGTSRLAFLLDPDEVWIELIERPSPTA